MTALVVEDEALIRMWLVDQLKRLNVTVIGAVDSGEAAILQARNLQPMLVFMDIRLAGEMDGLQAAQAIFQDQNPRIVFTSAFTYRERMNRLFPTKEVDFLDKPVSTKDLIRVLAVMG